MNGTARASADGVWRCATEESRASLGEGRLWPPSLPLLSFVPGSMEQALAGDERQLVSSEGRPVQVTSESLSPWNLLGESSFSQAGMECLS